MGESSRFEIIEAFCGFLSRWGDWPELMLFGCIGLGLAWLARSRVVCQGLALHDDRLNDFRGDREFCPAPYRQSAAQQHRSDTRMERLMAKAANSSCLKTNTIPFLRGTPERHLHSLASHYSPTAGTAGGRCLPPRRSPGRGSISTFIIFQT